MSQFSPATTPQDRAVSLWNEMHQLARKTVRVAWECGEALAEVKGSLEHGEWLPWLESHGINDRTAQRLMQLCDGYETRQLVEFHSVDEAIKALPPKRNAPMRPTYTEPAADEQPLTSAEKKLVELDHAKQEAQMARQQAAEAAEKVETQEKVIEALETEVKAAGGKPQVRGTIEGQRQEILQLTRKLTDAENEITELRKENASLRRLLKKANGE